MLATMKKVEGPMGVSSNEKKPLRRTLLEGASIGSSSSVEDVEISLLLEGIYRVRGVDFRDYAMPSLKRRIRRIVTAEGLQTISQLQDRIFRDPLVWRRFVSAITINVTSLFRDPQFYLAMREYVVPLLRKLPFIRIWHAGCATGEEVYSFAIVLEEEGLLDKCRIYATDINEPVLKIARAGIYPLAVMEAYTSNYIASGGKSNFEDYYTSKYENAIMQSRLKERVVFSRHDLALDGNFNEFNLIFCRNVMIYFNKELQGRVHALLYQSLAHNGILALGKKETIRYTPLESLYATLDKEEQLYQKIS